MDATDTDRYAIVGSGKIGAALAELFTRAGIEVGIANTRGPDSLRELAASRGPALRPLSLTEALEREIIFLAVPFPAIPQVGAARPDWTGKLVVDTTNAHYSPGSEDVLQGRASAHYTAGMLPGATVVKAFNQLPAATLTAELDAGAGRRVVFIAADEPAAGDRIAALAGALGLAAVQLGRIDEGGRLIQVPGPLVLRHLVERPL
ncbi:NADPH-dependent F420 reductase [Dactylosporangium sp. NPDC051541]|uniref:NADPH-dependent F420 reductase n=1 Tax=Dactylosporangium sp. NPDC051541 TaxID=3363977 RepID=UPI0037B648BF